jgi:hypothetical protein
VGNFFPLGKIRMPKRNSPRITGSTAMSGSCARSQSTTRESGDGFVGSLKTSASTRSTQSQWEQKKPYRDRRAASRWRLVPRSDSPNEAIVSTIKTLNSCPGSILSICGILPAKQSGPWERQSSSWKLNIVPPLCCQALGQMPLKWFPCATVRVNTHLSTALWFGSVQNSRYRPGQSRLPLP